MKLHTSFKMACGYILLTALLIGSIYYVYHQTASLTRMTGNEEVLAAHSKSRHFILHVGKIEKLAKMKLEKFNF